VRGFCCAPPSPRAMPAGDAADVMCAELGSPVDVVPDIDAAVCAAIDAAQMASAAVVVFGSMYLVHPARKAVAAAAE
jgi:folylpolyglutamate synthase/dihydropteroate synthase